MNLTSGGCAFAVEPHKSNTKIVARQFLIRVSFLRGTLYPDTIAGLILRRLTRKSFLENQEPEAVFSSPTAHPCGFSAWLTPYATNPAAIRIMPQANELMFHTCSCSLRITEKPNNNIGGMPTALAT